MSKNRVMSFLRLVINFIDTVAMINAGPDAVLFPCGIVLLFVSVMWNILKWCISLSAGLQI